MRLRIVASAFLAVAVISCSQSDHGAGPLRSISIEDEGAAVSLIPVFAGFQTMDHHVINDAKAIGDASARTTAAVVRIYLANYPLGIKDASKQDFEKAESAGQTRMQLQIELDEGAETASGPAPGTYTYKSEPFGRLSWISISRFENGRDVTVNLQPSKLTGSVRITEANANEITGSIDVTDGRRAVKGDFKATRF